MSDGPMEPLPWEVKDAARCLKEAIERSDNGAAQAASMRMISSLNSFYCPTGATATPFATLAYMLACLIQRLP
ncbi:hypothetical protein UFOVP119_51 [uncultured Caudovirales phage]|uniref:Uncharacterized protein n=1 Tax=uncultured Caudovirales phage TaxID=2100421 RepID=A0A6J5LBF7_9CAUD|nr:hypothetical protein UFOVP119_51 [uncultured Caudovirales phage]